MSRPFRLEDIIKPPPTQWYERPYAPVYQKKYYIDDLRRNYRQWGLDEKRVDEIEARIPEFETTHTQTEKEKLNVENFDKLKLILSIEGENIKVKIDSSMYDMYNDYISKAIKPPIELQVKAYKSVGASDEYIEKFLKNIERKKKYASHVDKIIEKVFEKEQKKPQKKKKPIEKEPEEEEEEIVEEEEEDHEGEELVDEDDEDDEEEVQEEEIDLDED
jgi:hypothetical protein